ncbi:30S ribosomal protein S13 [Planctomycetales bacterium]|nr:30S ribosomal protein S13 [Planctomycetales bacterium]GHS99786.1 30S ribosomal protein S13 [Planctomycetales bacterium]GHT07222.1 30S ribosomal protein S13 [Planctomycetales bacterium]
MPRLLGVDIPNDKIVAISLTYVYGVGRRTALDICKEVRVNPQLRASKLTESELSRIASLLEGHYVVEGQLRRQINQNIGRLKKIGCYRGIRHGRNLPVRGQRTRTNARTRKGKRKTVAGKKSVKAMR